MSQIKTKFITDASVTNSKVSSGIDATKIADGSVTNTEFQYLNSVTSDIQTQLNGKEPTITTLAVNKGGTGQTSYTDGQLLIGNSTGNTLDKATLTAGANVSITNGGGSITVAAPSILTGFNYVSVTSSTTLTINDYALLSGASFSFTLPTAVGNDGKGFAIQHNGTSLTQVYTINTTSSQTIGGVAGGSYALYTNGEFLMLISDGANWQIVSHKTETGWSSTSTTTITATTTNPTKGTTTVDTIRWRRVGANAEIMMSYKQSTTGSNGSGDYLFGLPSNITANTTDISLYTTVLGTTTPQPTNIVGHGACSTQGPNASTSCVSLYSSTSFRLINLAGAGVGSPGSGTFGIGTNSGVGFNAWLSIPISGWQP